MKTNYETKLVGLVMGGGLIWGSLMALLDKSLGIGALIAGVMIMIFWAFFPGDEQ